MARPLRIECPGACYHGILGSDSFVDRVRRRYLLSRKAVRDEEPALDDLTHSLDPLEIVEIEVQGPPHWT